MIVIDAMILTYFVLRHPGFTEKVDPIFSADLSFAAPPLWRSELRNSLLQYVQADEVELTLGTAVALMKDAEQLLEATTFDVSSEPVLTLTSSSGCTAYDCEYVALARAFDTSLVTFDGQVLEAFPETGVHPDDFDSEGVA